MTNKEYQIWDEKWCLVDSENNIKAKSVYKKNCINEQQVLERLFGKLNLKKIKDVIK